MTYAAKITTADARIDWRNPAEHIQRTARAHTPAPGAWTTLAGDRYKIGLMLPVSDYDGLSVGEVVAGKSRVLVGTGDGVLQITRIQPPGKKMMTAADWARGRDDLFAGDGLVTFDEISGQPENDDEGEN